MARAALRWTAKELAEKAGVSWATVQRMETSKGEAPGLAKNVNAVQRALEGAGVEFTNDEAPGVWLKPTKRKR